MTSLPAVNIVWFKRDLRIADHLPLVKAAQAGPCFGLYVYEPELIEAADFDAAHLKFINESLVELRQRFRELGSELVLRRGEVTEVIEQLGKSFQVAAIWAHEETGNGISYARDRRMRKWCRSQQIKFRELPTNGVVRRLKSRDGWARQWKQRMESPITMPPSEIRGVSVEDAGEFMQPEQFRVHNFDRVSVQLGGERRAIEWMASFLADRGENYRNEMSSPVTAFDSCSRLSPFIAYGNLSIRTVYQAVNRRREELKQGEPSTKKETSSWRKSLSSFQSRLSWHCHFIQKLEDEPEIEFNNVNRAYDGLRENEFNEDYFEAWCEGQTGYPMVDACMRALRQTGWINFRMRAMLMSFAAYHLWLHWRKPSLVLARMFLDYESGIHYPQCQMQSGVTGINTVRIYSPIKQVSDQDPQGVFVRKYVPELMHVPDKHLAEPHRMNAMEQVLFECEIGRDYPAPIVDHKERYKIARDRIHAAKKSRVARQTSEEVFQKHGSRKQPMSQRR